MKVYDLEERIIEFSVNIIKSTKFIEKSEPGKYLCDQLTRSSLSAALNYGEAKAAESRRDFIHKLKLALKELHESSFNLRILKGSELFTNYERLNYLFEECNELISIFSKSVITAQRNQGSKKA